MISLSLLRVIVDELLNIGLDECDLGEDFAGGRGPGERFGGGVPVGDVVADLFHQDGDRGEGAASDGLAGDDPEPGLDLVDPRRSGRGVVKMEAPMRR